MKSINLDINDQHSLFDVFTQIMKNDFDQVIVQVDSIKFSGKINFLSPKLVTIQENANSMVTGSRDPIYINHYIALSSIQSISLRGTL